MDEEAESLALAKRWCAARGADWTVTDQAGRGGTAPVYGIMSPDGLLALKVYDEKFSTGSLAPIEERRILQQTDMGRHGHPNLIEVFDGGRFEDRFFLLMNRAPGSELEKRLATLPREQIRPIVDKVARAAIFLRDRNLCHRDIKSANIFVSEDADTVTLLDLSVMRDITDPVGLGTDHGGMLPVVATARYSPPDYLFRLLDPGPEAWKALDIYQLGALLHDLIMRKPLFEDAYNASKENRYRFAWTVATEEPLLHAEDVDRDLLVLARRALDKNWQRRLELNLENFLDDTVVRQRRALGIIGFDKLRPSPSTTTAVQSRQRIHGLASELRELLASKLRDVGITAKHDMHTIDDTKVQLVLSWSHAASSDSQLTNYSLDLTLHDEAQTDGSSALPHLSLRTDSREVGVILPPSSWGLQTASEITDAVMATLGELADRLMKSNTEEVA